MRDIERRLWTLEHETRRARGQMDQLGVRLVRGFQRVRSIAMATAPFLSDLPAIETGDYYTLRIRVLCCNTPYEGATVTLYETGTQPSRVGTTDANGYATFANYPGELPETIWMPTIEDVDDPYDETVTTFDAGNILAPGGGSTGTSDGDVNVHVLPKASSTIRCDWGFDEVDYSAVSWTFSDNKGFSSAASVVTVNSKDYIIADSSIGSYGGYAGHYVFRPIYSTALTLFKVGYQYIGIAENNGSWRTSGGDLYVVSANTIDAEADVSGTANNLVTYPYTTSLQSPRNVTIAYS